MPTMFVHAGAGLHGHEFSSKDRNRSPEHHMAQTRPLPLLRSALLPLSESRHSTSGLRPSSIAESDDSSTPSTRPLPRRPVSEIFHKKDLAVRFQDPPMVSSVTPSLTTDEEGDEDDSTTSPRESSDIPTAAATRRRRRKSLPRPGTRYALALPAPMLRTKKRMLVQIRPRLLLQLQDLNQHRPTPAFDVVPSSIVAGSLIIPKLAKRFPRIFMAKPDLCPDDVLLVRSEDYDDIHEDHETSVSDERLQDRELMAVISPLMGGGDENLADIIMGDGSVWSASRMANGSYEFTRVDSTGFTTVARWVRKPAGPTRKDTAPSNDGNPDPSTPSSEDRWTFSVLDPSTRRHPIMGVLVPHELQVYDTYTTPATPNSRSKTEIVPEECRQLMTVTASYISLRLAGWPASTNPKLKRASTYCRDTVHRSASERRRTFPLAESSSSTVSSPGAAEGPSSFLPRRASSTSTGMNGWRKERMSDISAPGLDVPVEMASPEEAGPVAQDAEKGGQCRTKMRRFTQRLFRRGSAPAR